MGNAEQFEFNGAEALGYVGGIVLASALVPQVIYTCKSKSTADFSYTWQLIYVLGLILSFCYYFWIEATAGWITISIELVFAVILLVMKIRIDGCRPKKNNDEETDDEDCEKQVRPFAITRSISGRVQGRSSIKTTVDLNESINGINNGDAFHFNKRMSVPNEATLMEQVYQGFHIMIDALFDITLPVDFGVTMMNEMLHLAELHDVKVIHHHVETFDGSDSPPGFASAALIDKSHMTAHCYSEQGMLSFDVFTCGAEPDKSRKVARDVLVFLRLKLGENAKFYIHRLPRFPKKISPYEET